MSSMNHAEMTDDEFELILHRESQLFEDELNSRETLQDPKERTRLRHIHYQKQSEKRLERMRALGTLAKKKEREFVSGSTLSRIKKKCTVDFLHGREFEAHGANKIYHGPLITPSESSEALLNEQTNLVRLLERQDKVSEFVPFHYPGNSSGNSNTEDETRAEQQYAIFLGEDGTLYDRHYIPILRQDPEHLPTRGKLSRVQKEGLKLQHVQHSSNAITVDANSDNDDQNNIMGEYEFIYDPEQYQSIPNPYSYATFDEYEQALHNWEEDVKNRLGYLQLPIVMGRHFFRPNVSQEKSSLDADVTVAKKKKRISTFMENTISGPQHSSVVSGAFNNLFEGEETWESNLVPLEPKPEFYDTFEEYEKAMIRWCIVCMGLPQLPPHPAQLQKLLGLRIVDPPSHPIPDVEVNTLTKKKSEDEDEEEDKRQYTTINNRQGRKGRIKKRRRRPSDIDHVYRDNEDHLLYKGSDEWSKLKEQDKEVIRKAFDTVWQTQCRNKDTYAVFHTQMTPTIHGIFSADEMQHKLMRRLSLSNFQLSVGAKQKARPETVREWIVQQRRERSLSSVFAKSSVPYYLAIAEDLKHQIPLRRTDMTVEELDLAHDCNAEEQGKPITFKVPDFDIGQIDFTQLKQESYIRFLQILLKRIDHGNRYASLNTWYYPKIPQQVHEDKINELAATFDNIQHPTQIDTKMFIKIFNTNAYLDSFAEFMDRYMKQRCFLKGNKEITVFHELLHHATTVDSFKAMLSLFYLSRSQLVHAKTAFYISNFLKTEKSKAILQNIIFDRDIRSLHAVAVAITFYDEVPIQLFQYTVEMQALVKIKYGQDVNDFFNRLAIIYYLDCICVSLLEEDKEFPFIYPLLIDMIESHLGQVVSFLKGHPDLLQYHIWSLLGSRSKQLCALGRFVLSFLFFLSYNVEIQGYIKAASTNLVDNIRQLATSKIGHVQVSVARLFPTLEEERWKGLLTSTYSKAANVVNDLVKSAEHSALDSQPPLISSMVYEFLEDALTIRDRRGSSSTDDDEDDDDTAEESSDESYQMILGLIQEEGFHSVLSEVLATSRERRMHQGTIMGAMFLAKFAKFVVCNHMIVGEDEKKKATTGGTILSMFRGKKKKDSAPEFQGSDYAGPKLVITASDINQIMDFVCNENTKMRRAYRPRMFMLETLRHLLKCPSVFDLVNLDKTLFTRIQDICEDGMDMEFNRNAWRLFYQLIKFHAGTIESVIKHNLMASFLELIGSKIGKSSTVTTNSIHYFNKIFNLPENTNVVAANDNEYAEDDDKPTSPSKYGFNVPSPFVVEKYAASVKALSDHIINRQLYNIFHFVYTKLITNYQGWPFQSMVALYHTLDTHSSCTKIAQLFKKQKEYKDGLDLIAEMIGGDRITHNE